MKGMKASEEKYPGVLFGEETEIGENVKIGAGCTLAGKVVLGAGCSVGPGCFVKDSVIGEGSILQAGNTVEGCSFGKNCFVYPHSWLYQSAFGDGCEIYPNNFIRKGSFGEGCVLYPNNYVDVLSMGKGSSLSFSHAEKTSVGEGVSIGPFARLRPSAAVCDRAKIGNFVEIKNSVVGEGTKVSHLAYVGDADLGRECNVGCGAIFVNYDGKNKHRASVGNDCFIGSNCNVIAPVTLADGSYVCAGTTVTENTEEGDFVIGRSRQENKKGKGRRYR
ncbi:MAG: DapH/DapD/GlmU-related protein [Candidatus Borkfalkiaceae bacterium]|nr:DapH/DapD/GlmU-related protein [Christensenellaceae bacterium]